MHEGVTFLFPARHRFFVHGSELCDLAGELLIQELPSLPTRQLRGDQAATGAILAFDGNHPEHRLPPH